MKTGEKAGGKKKGIFSMRKMVVHGCTGLKNSGDEAILQAIIQQYAGEYEMTVISRNVPYTERLHPRVAVIPDEKAVCRKAIRECDVFLLGGGGLLQDETTVYNVAVWLKYLKYAIRVGRKTVVYANSVGPLKYRLNRMLVKKYLSRVDVITLREGESAGLLRQIGIPGEKLHVTADPVFALEWARRPVEGEPYVCMALRHWFDIIPFIPVKICNRLHIRSAANRKRYGKYIDTMAETVRYVNEELGYRVVFLSFLYGRDDRVAEDVLSKVAEGLPSKEAEGVPSKEAEGVPSKEAEGVPSKEAESALSKVAGMAPEGGVSPERKLENAVAAGECMTPDEALNIIAGARFVVAMRLHAMIYAIRTLTPAVVIDYSAKVGAMARRNHLEAYCVDVGTMDAGQVKGKIRKLLGEEDEVKKALARQRTEMEGKERENKEWVDRLVGGTARLDC